MQKTYGVATFDNLVQTPIAKENKFLGCEVEVWVASISTQDAVLEIAPKPPKVDEIEF